MLTEDQRCLFEHLLKTAPPHTTETLTLDDAVKFCDRMHGYVVWYAAGYPRLPTNVMEIAELIGSVRKLQQERGGSTLLLGLVRPEHSRPIHENRFRLDERVRVTTGSWKDYWGRVVRIALHPVSRKPYYSVDILSDSRGKLLDDRDSVVQMVFQEPDLLSLDWPMLIRKFLDDDECPLSSEVLSCLDTEDLLRLAARELDVANVQELFGNVRFVGADGQTYQLTAEAVVSLVSEPETPTEPAV